MLGVAGQALPPTEEAEAVRHRLYGWPWPKVRKAVLERDGYVCQIKGPRCTQVATQGDHIIPILQGGAPYDMDNLRAACKNCNLDRVGELDDYKWRGGVTLIRLVIGSDARTYVRDRAGPADLVVDMAALEASLGSHTAAAQAWRDVIHRLRRARTSEPHAWIIGDEMTALEVPHHEVVRAGAVDTRRPHGPTSSGTGDATPSRDW